MNVLGLLQLRKSFARAEAVMADLGEVFGDEGLEDEVSSKALAPDCLGCILCFSFFLVLSEAAMADGEGLQTLFQITRRPRTWR